MTGFPEAFPLVFAGARFAVVGLGRMGLPAAQALAAMGALVVAWDDGAEARAQAAALHVEDPAPQIARFDALVLSPGIPHRLPHPHPAAAAALAAGVPIWTDAELLYQAVRRAGSKARFAGITGTNGKSTTTALLAHILVEAGIPAAAGGNLSPAALALPLLPDAGAYALEMSSYMLERLATLRFDAAAMLNLSPDHLDRHGDMEGYIAAKRAIFARQDASDLAVVGADDPDSDALAASLPSRVLRVSGLHEADLWCEAGVLRDADGPILPMADALALPGPHNAQNAAAAAALAFHLGAARDAVARGIATFAGLPHRQRLVAAQDGIAFVDDSKATNADAAARALACYDRVVWIAGGIAKAGGIASLAPFFPRIAHAVLIGRDATLLARQLQDGGVPHHVAGTLDSAVPDAFAFARRLGAPTVLLSPACASFDQFSGFEARGRRFAALANALRNGKAA